MSGGSASRNTEALANQEVGGSGEFSSRRERDEPLTTHGHKPGVLTGNDTKPEFSAQTLPPGTAPKESTFQPNPVSDVPPVAPLQKNAEADSGITAASDTLGGSTSAQVNTGLGKPIQGQTSQELRHDNDKRNGGTEGLNTTTERGTVNPHLPEHASQRALDNDEAQVGRGNTGGPAAQDRLAEGAETVARESRS